jgi:hypothetical protein
MVARRTPPRASGQISKNVEAISSGTDQSASGTQQIARAAEDLNRLAENLQQLVAKFTLGGETRYVTTQAKAKFTTPRSKVAVRANGALVPHDES